MTILLAACQPMPAMQVPPNTPAPTVPTPVVAATATPVPPTQTPAGEPAAAQNMRVVLERWFGDAGTNARLENARETEWPDTCFGAGYPYETCGLVITPGWELTFIVDGATYTFRTDPQAHRFRLMVAPAPDIGETIVSWTGNNGAEVGGCAMAEISATAVALGDCGGQMVTGRFVNEAHRENLKKNGKPGICYLRNASNGAQQENTTNQASVHSGIENVRNVQSTTPHSPDPRRMRENDSSGPKVLSR